LNIDSEKLREGYNKIIGEINQPHRDLKKVAERILDIIVDVFGADRADLAIIRDDYDPEIMPFTEGNTVRLRVTNGYREKDWKLLKESGVLMESIRNAVINKKSVIFSDTRDEDPEHAQISSELEHGCWMNYVLILNDKTIANVHLAKKERFYYQYEELKQLEYMSQLLATAINVAGLWEKERLLILEFINSLNMALEVRDKSTAGHVARVKLYSELIAEEMNLKTDEIELIKSAAILHDIGKIGVPDSILKKEGSLNKEEREAIQKHVTMTNQILKNLSYLDEAREIACCHHEMYDGSGYVMGLKGEEIPLGARIIAVADSFDAMTSDRPYRRAFYVEEAINIIQDPNITQWDMTIVNVFAQLLRTDNFRLRAEKEGLICYKEGIYDREGSSLKFKQFSQFFSSK